MSAKVVMIVEDKYARFWPGCFAEKMRRGEAADATANNDQVVFFVGVDRDPACSQKVPSRRLWAASNDPGWLPRNPVKAGG